MICEEIWRAIDSFEGYYQISNFGRVKSVRRVVRVNSTAYRPYDRTVAERILKPGLGHGGHHSVTLWREHEEIQARVHILVLEHFSGPRPDGLYGCHWDGNPANNRLDNLYWGTPAENSADKLRHGTQPFGEELPWAKLTAADVVEIRSAKGRVPQEKLGARYGIRQAHVSRIMSGRAWPHVQPVGVEA